MAFKRFGRWAVILAVLMATVACGAQDGDSDSAGPPASPAAESTGGVESSPSGGNGLGDDQCRDYANAFAGFEPGPSGASNFNQIADALEKAAEEVPNEISDDLRVVAAAYRNFADSTSNIDMGDPSSMASASPEELKKMEESLRGMDTPEVRAAVANIEAFVAEHCPQG